MKEEIRKAAAATVIVFPYGWFPQAPTVMGLYSEIKKYGDVKILTMYNEQRGSITGNPDFIYLNQFNTRLGQKCMIVKSHFLSKLIKLFRFILPKAMSRYKKLDLEKILIFLQIKSRLKQVAYKNIIAVDVTSALYCQLKKLNYHFLSTELQAELLDDMKSLDHKRIESIVIQSLERYDLLTIPGKELIHDIFFIQNAPIYTKPSKRTSANRSLIFAGALWEGFGFVYCLEFVRQFRDFTLTVKGTPQSDIEFYKRKYADEIGDGIVCFDLSYSDPDTFSELLSQHSIGFSFYDENNPTIKASAAHYNTAPSGKMFSYFAAGIPVVGSAGLTPIKEFEAGITISDYSPISIHGAIKSILADYQRYSDNALKAASHYSADKMAKPFIDYLCKQVKSLQ